MYPSCMQATQKVPLAKVWFSVDCDWPVSLRQLRFTWQSSQEQPGDVMEQWMEQMCLGTGPNPELGEKPSILNISM